MAKRVPALFGSFAVVFRGLPDDGSGYPAFDSAGQRVEIQDPVAILFNRAQRESQNAVHEVERVSLDVKGPVGRIWVEQVVADPPGARIAMIVDEEAVSGHVGDVDERVVALVATAHVHRDRDEQGLVLKLIRRELVSAQDLVRPQRERQQLRTADLPLAEFAGIEDPQSAARVHLRITRDDSQHRR